MFFKKKKKAFDINALDTIDLDSSKGEWEMEDFIDHLIDRFIASPEGQETLKSDAGMGFWTAQLILYGSDYIGVTLTQMTVRDVDELLTDIFPRKISLHSPDDADDAIPELISFWQFLLREYQLPNAEAILIFLQSLDRKKFKKEMNNPENFGMAKSFLMMGQSAGYDMTNQKDMDRFKHAYNAHLMSQEMDPELPPSLPDFGSLSHRLNGTSGGMGKSHNRKKRRMAKASRKKNRKKRK